MIKIILADDHRLMREGLRGILRVDSRFDVIGEATNAEEVLNHVNQGKAEVIILDLSMPGSSGVELIKKIHGLAPRIGVLVLTMHAAQHYAPRAFRAGAMGYLTKENAACELISAICTIAAGKPYICPKVAEQLALSTLSTKTEVPHALLSYRELQVFSLLVRGGSVTDTAEKLCLSVKTVSTHKTRILSKLESKNLPQLVQYAMEHGLMAGCVAEPVFKAQAQQFSLQF